MEERVFVEVQIVVLCNKKSSCGNGYWQLPTNESLLTEFVQAVSTAIMVATARFVESSEFRVDLTFNTFKVAGSTGDALSQLCKDKADASPERISWREGKPRLYERGNRGS